MSIVALAILSIIIIIIGIIMRTQETQDASHISIDNFICKKARKNETSLLI